MIKILLVDDDQEQLALRCMLLEHYGFDPECASDPEAALAVARETRPDVAVLDLRLPTEEQGLLLITHLKEALPAVSIIVLTGSPQAELRSHPEVTAWLTKGGGTRILIDTLQKLAA